MRERERQKALNNTVNNYELFKGLIIIIKI